MNHSEANQVGGTQPSFKQWAQKHRTVILLTEELLGRMLYWVPMGTNDETRFREVAWGLLQLHRLLFDVFTAENPQSYGTSVAVNPSIPANQIRLVLSVLQHLWPVAYELARTSSGERRRTRVRVWIERLRFVLRLTLLGSYWNRLSASGHAGVLLNGGTFHNVSGYMAEHERKCADRSSYRGRRSGRQVAVRKTEQSCHLEFLPARWKQRILQLAEFAYISRPLLLTETETQQIGCNWNIFWASLLVDLSSVELLERLTPVGNDLTHNELKRRKFRILFYLLREPCWVSITHPMAERLAAALESFPVGGKLLRNYLWEYLLYARLYLVEE